MVSVPKFDTLRQADWQHITQVAVYVALVITFVVGGGGIIASGRRAGYQVTLEEVKSRKDAGSRGLVQARF
jgi:hypothetical protein